MICVGVISFVDRLHPVESSRLILLNTHLLKVRWPHVAQSLCGDFVVSQDGQIVLSGQLTQDVDEPALHASLLPKTHRLTAGMRLVVTSTGGLWEAPVGASLHLHAQGQRLGVQEPLVLDHPVILLVGVRLLLQLHLKTNEKKKKKRIHLVYNNVLVLISVKAAPLLSVCLPELDAALALFGLFASSTAATCH